MENRAKQILAILDEKSTAAERKTKLSDIFTTSEGRGCVHTYSENYKTDDSCPSGIAVQGVTTITNCPNDSDNGTYTGSWHCQ